MRFFLFLIVFLFVACQNQQSPETKEIITKRPLLSKSDSIINASNMLYNMKKLEKSKVSFLFRDFEYTANFDDGLYKYTRKFIAENGDTIFDVLTNSAFERFVNSEKTEVSEEKAKAYSNSINSVFYFFLLPQKLNDPAVKKEYIGKTSINSKDYHTIKVTFQPIGGGEDHEDEFMYWFETSTFKMEMFAYNYQTNGGGIRFRTLKNDTVSAGITFQNYYNLKPNSLTTPLDSLPFLWTKNQLDTLSVIENKNIMVTLFD